MKYKYTNVPSLIQQDRSEDEAICFICKRGGVVEFHHILNGSLRKVSEEIGAWVWLCPTCHRKIHNYRHGVDNKLYDPRWLKGLCQEVYETSHTTEEWMAKVHKNYVEERLR